MSPKKAAEGAAADPFVECETFEDFKNASEKLFLEKKLLENNGNIKRTAERLQMMRSTSTRRSEAQPQSGPTRAPAHADARPARRGIRESPSPSGGGGPSTHHGDQLLAAGDYEGAARAFERDSREHRDRAM